jgi:hypothetical protein
MQLASFDIFDTVLTRTVAAPRDLFLLLAERLRARQIIMLEAAAFADARVRAERRARARRPDGEVTLAEIYDELAAALKWPGAARTEAEAAELETEADCLRAVPVMKTRVAAARQAGSRIAFLSDMYLPAAFLEKVLRREGLFQDGDALRVSGEARASKAAGTLFARLRQTLPPETDWRHVGDNQHADVVMPRAQQIMAEKFSDAHLTCYEQLARGREDTVPLWRSQLAGAMRLARLANPETEPRRRAIWESGAEIVGPLFLGFVQWCLAEARARGIRRLYFVARDGQIMHQLAERIVLTTNAGVECRYLHGSRQAWNPASIDRFGPAEFGWVLPSTRRLTLDQIFRRVGLQAEDFAGLLARAGFAPGSWREPLHGGPQQLSGLLLQPELVAAIEAAARTRRAVVLRYLAQEGFFDGVPFAIVDIGWHGNMQKNLARLLSLSDHPASAKLMGFYLGLVQTNRFNAEQVMEGYLNQDTGLEREFKRQNLFMFELFAAADHGSVTGYEERDGRICPTLAGQRNERALTWGLEALQAAVRRFADASLENCRWSDCPVPDYRRLTFQLFRRFYARPALVEAAAWGGFQFSEEQHEQHFQQMVPAWSGWQTLRALGDPNLRPAGWWAEGMLALRPSLPLRAYLQARRLKAKLSTKTNGPK